MIRAGDSQERNFLKLNLILRTSLKRDGVWPATFPPADTQTPANVAKPLVGEKFLHTEDPETPQVPWDRRGCRNYFWWHDMERPEVFFCGTH